MAVPADFFAGDFFGVAFSLVFAWFLAGAIFFAGEFLGLFAAVLVLGAVFFAGLVTDLLGFFAGALLAAVAGFFACFALAALDPADDFVVLLVGGMELMRYAGA